MSDIEKSEPNVVRPTQLTRERAGDLLEFGMEYQITRPGPRRVVYVLARDADEAAMLAETFASQLRAAGAP